MIDKDTYEAADDDAADNAGATPELNLASTPVDFARLGLAEMAYIRQALVNDNKVWAIFSASGEPIGAAETFDQAWGAVVQNNLTPQRVH